MKIHAAILVSLATVLAAGCAYLPLKPEARTDDAINISWEDNGDDHLVISYRHGKPGSSESKGGVKDAIQPIILKADTVSNDHAALFSEINSWMGTPYGYGMHVKRKGTDCSGFTMEIYQNVYNIKLNRSSDAQVANTVEVKKEDLQIGDLVFYNIRGSRISHVGLYIGNNKFVHSTVQQGVIISDMDEKYYKQRYARSGRVITGH